MKSHEHAAVGGVVSVLFVLFALDVPTPVAFALIGWGTVLSVVIDLDHFVLARYYVGDWRHLRRCLGNPVWAFTDQEEIFGGPEVVAITRGRVRTHFVIGTVLVAVLWVRSPPLAAFTALVLAVHIGCDLLRDRELV